MRNLKGSDIQKFIALFNLKETVIWSWTGSVLRNTKQLLKNLYYYRSWLYNSRNWDYSWLLKIILLWLKSFQNHTTTCTAGRKDKETHLNEAISLLEAIIKDEWVNEEEKVHDKKWGKLWTTSKKVKHTWGNGKTETVYQMTFHRYNAKTPKQKKQERKEKTALYKLEIERRKKAINRFFYLFKRYFQNWWC